MQIYKLFSKSPKLKDVKKVFGEVPMIFGNSKENFGVAITPENYREFINSISSQLQNSKIRQHIMTDYKFIELLNKMELLNVKVNDINFYNEEQLYDDEIYSDLKSALWKENTIEIIGLVNELVENGYKINSVTAYSENSDYYYEKISIFSNGTIALDNFEDIKNKGIQIIDFLVKGPKFI